jgi:putative sterol carrier protein
VVHCHAPLINGYFAVAKSLKALTFETKFYLGEVPVVEQDTPTVTKPEKVIEALKINNVAVLKNHGVVAISDTFNEAMALTESLEEAVRTAAVARLFDKDILDDLDKALSEKIYKDDEACQMFSSRHIEKIVELVNKDDFIAEKGKELDLTVTLAIKLNEEDKAYRFSFKKGKVVELKLSTDAPFVISAGRDVWKEVFLGRIDPFVAVTQGRMQLEGSMGMLSRWYVPFSRLFELFKQVNFI